MKATIIAATHDLSNVSDEGILQENKTFSGKMAGICYQKDKYFGSSVSDPEKAAKRFAKVASTGHHSIADHTFVTVLFEDISKFLAMILNNTNFYNTSEKSGRYTVMEGNSAREKELYNKWLAKFHELILKEYPDYDDDFLQEKLCAVHSFVKVINGRTNNAMCNEILNDFKEHNESLPSRKLAQENARYVLSVFTRSTTMAFTTSLRQWNYIYDWCNDAIARCESRGTKFYEEVKSDLEFLADFISVNLYVNELRDIKGRHFSMLLDLYKDVDPLDKYDFEKDDHYGFAYSTSYDTSFVALAQEHRHRTLNYYMFFNPEEEHCFYRPEILYHGDKFLMDEWLDDLRSIEDIYPQATKVDVIETGTLPDFALKCKERLCGRAQHETMRNVSNIVDSFAAEYKSLTKCEQLMVDEFTDAYGYPKTKCQMLSQCKEPCYWGCQKALTRYV